MADRLAEGRPIPLLLDPEIRAVIFPTSASELETLKRLWAHQQMWAAARALQSQSVREGTDTLSIDHIDDVIAATHADAARRELAIWRGAHGTAR